MVDASVAAKWYLPPSEEHLADEALNLLAEYGRGRIQLRVPDLFWAEIGSILWKALRLNRISNQTATEALLALEQQSLMTGSCRPLLGLAFEIAKAFHRSVYDGIYVALAVTSGCELVTADERLANALAAYYPVRWLGSL